MPLLLVAVAAFSVGLLTHALILAATMRAVTREQRRLERLGRGRFANRPRENLTLVSGMGMPAETNPLEDEEQHKEERQAKVAAYEFIQRERSSE